MTKLVKEYLSQEYINYLIKKNSDFKTEITLQQTEECLRFLYLASFTSGSIPVNQKIDQIWHFLILETKAYAALCEKLPAKKFIHHTSDIFSEQNENINKRSYQEESKVNLEWLVSYVANFGEFTLESIEYWPYANSIMQQLNLDINLFNKKLLSLINKKI